ncbi:interleukin-18-like isoform X2 [Heteronotia binoei]|uniref:interleukin-18-like isoform X2 n=1 Tax=Heteronotia binoei TaxID=13085 RepID=UPI002930309E|nr:interleukin-18-like isoform X2 [Heteronotia binoei]
MASSEAAAGGRAKEDNGLIRVFPVCLEGDGTLSFRESGIRFTIHSYDDTVPRGKTVALTTRKNNKTYCLCAEKQANGELRVAFPERNIPERISGETSDIIFFQIPFSEGDSKFFKFESTLERGYFLAFERGEGSHTRRLVMKRVLAKDEVDETMKLFPSSR